MAKERSFKEIFTSISEGFVELADKLDALTIIKITVDAEDEGTKPSPIPTPIPTPIENPYKDVFIPIFNTPYTGVKEYTLVGYTKGLTGVNEPLYVVTFTDFLKRSYTQDKNGKYHNKGKNIYTNPNTVIVDKSMDWGTLVIDDVTANGGNAPSKYYAQL